MKAQPKAAPPDVPVAVPLAPAAKDPGRPAKLPPRPFLRQTMTLTMPGDLHSEEHAVTLEVVAVCDMRALNDAGGPDQGDPFLWLARDYSAAGWSFREWGNMTVGVRIIEG